MAFIAITYTIPYSNLPWLIPLSTHISTYIYLFYMGSGYDLSHEWLEFSRYGKGMSMEETRSEYGYLIKSYHT